MRYVLIIVAIVLLPQVVHADVRITEVAWMGTSGSQYSEWVELSNDGDTAVDLAGWKLYKAGSTLVFTLTKSIEAKGYLLIERTTASAPDAVPGIDDEAGPFGGGGFANTGENLTLKDTDGNTVDTLDYASGWPAGDATTKQTMQWDGSTWITAVATPDEGTGAQSDTGSGTGAKTSLEPKDPAPIPKVSPNEPHIEFTVPSIMYRGVTYQFEAQPVYGYNYRIHEGSVIWNMGDGTVIRGTVVAPIQHTYQYPGTYTISFLFTDPTHQELPLTATKKITVALPAITTAVVEGKALQLTNTSSKQIDLSGWKIVAGGQRLTIPDMTIIAEKATVVIPFAAFGIAPVATIALTDPSDVVVARTGAITGTAPTTAAPSPDDTLFVSADDLVAQAPVVEDIAKSPTPIRNHTKTIVFGVVALFVIGLSILLERVMARQEYQEE